MLRNWSEIGRKTSHFGKLMGVTVQGLERIRKEREGKTRCWSGYIGFKWVIFSFGQKVKSVSLDVGLMVSLCKSLFRKLSISSRPWLTENGRRFFIFRRPNAPCEVKTMRDMLSTPLHNNLRISETWLSPRRMWRRCVTTILFHEGRN